MPFLQVCPKYQRFGAHVKMIYVFYFSLLICRLSTCVDSRVSLVIAAVSSTLNLVSDVHRSDRYPAACYSSFFGFFSPIMSETSDTAVCQMLSLPLTWPIFDIMLSLSLHSPKKELSCFSRPDNYFPLIPPCQGQSQP